MITKELINELIEAMDKFTKGEKSDLRVYTLNKNNKLVEIINASSLEPLNE